MLRCASSFPCLRRGSLIAAYTKLRLIPQDRERKPEAPLAGRRGAKKNRGFLLAVTRGPEGGESIARLTCGTFYEAVPNLRLLLLFASPSSLDQRQSEYEDGYSDDLIDIGY
jgi:hypothetical protein